MVSSSNLSFENLRTIRGRRRKPSNHSKRLVHGMTNFLYFADIPIWSRSKNRRIIKRMALRLPHEAVYDMYVKDPLSVSTASQDPDILALDVFRSNPAVHRAGMDDVIFFTLYSDSTPCRAKMRDSFHACYVSLPWPGSSRNLSYIYLKSQLCRCGCKGQCTTNSINKVMIWSVNAGLCRPCLSGGCQLPTNPRP